MKKNAIIILLRRSFYVGPKLICCFGNGMQAGAEVNVGESVLMSSKELFPFPLHLLPFSTAFGNDLVHTRL